MMGGQEEELKSKIEEMEEVNTAGRKLINVQEFQKRKKKMQEQTYIWDRIVALIYYLIIRLCGSHNNLIDDIYWYFWF